MPEKTLQARLSLGTSLLHEVLAAAEKKKASNNMTPHDAHAVHKRQTGVRSRPMRHVFLGQHVHSWRHSLPALRLSRLFRCPLASLCVAMAPKCRAGPPAGANARITGYARSDLGGAHLSMASLGRVVVSSPDGHVVDSLGGLLFTFEPDSVFRFVPQGEVDAMKAKTPPQGLSPSLSPPRGRVRFRSPSRPPARKAP